MKILRPIEISTFKNAAIILLSICFLSCDKDELPEETQLGENTFGMLVNDTLWQPLNFSIFTPGGKKPEIYYYNSSEFLVVKASNVETNENFHFSVSEIKEMGIYNVSPSTMFPITDSLNFHCQDTTRFEYDWDCNTSYKLKKSLNSLIRITRFDTIENVISGTFEMKLIDGKNDTMTISNGVFDSNFIKI